MCDKNQHDLTTTGESIALLKWCDIIVRKINPQSEKAREALKHRLLSELPMAALTEIHWKLVANRDGTPLSEMASDFYREYVHPQSGYISVKYWHLMEDSWNDMMSYMAKEAGKFLSRVLSALAEHAPSPGEVREDALGRALEKLLPNVRSGGFKWDSTLHTYATTILHNEILQILRGSNPLSTPWFSKNYDDVNFGVFVEQLLTWQDPLTLRLRQDSLRAVVAQLEHASDRRPTPALEQALIDGLNQALKDPLLVPAAHSSKAPKSTPQEPSSRHLAERNRSYLTSVYGPSAVHPPRQLASMRHPGEGVHIVSLEAEIVSEGSGGAALSEIVADPTSADAYEAVEAVLDVLSRSRLDSSGIDKNIIRHAIEHARVSGRFPSPSAAAQVASICGCEVNYAASVLNALQNAVRCLRARV